MTDLANRGLVARAERLDRAVAAVHKRFAPLFPGGEIQETGRAIWTLSATPLLVANGVIRYDARDFDGPDSDRDLDSCLAVLSTYDVPWRFSAWEHLGADRLLPRLIARGLIGKGRAPALWLDLQPGAHPTATTTTTPTTPGTNAGTTTSSVDDGIQVRPAVKASDHRLWVQIFTEVFKIPGEYAAVFELIVGKSHTFSAVAYVDGRPAGCLSLAIEDGIAVVDNVGVLPAFRRRGVGRHLMEAAHEAAATRGAKACVVVASPAGAAVCARLGYQVVTSVTHLMPAAQAS